MIAGDADCDGVLTADDCDDADNQSNTVAQDGDCDGVLTAADCNDADSASTVIADDGDCDGILTADDCNDADPASTAIADDGDCDGVVAVNDCNDADASVLYLGDDISCPGASCKAILDTGVFGDGVRWVDRDGSGNPVQVYCDMDDDGGGWILVFSNANNWASGSSSNLSSASGAYKWYDSTWGVTSIQSSSRLGGTWNGSYPLSPTDMGGINVEDWYNAGFQSVRFEFVRGSDLHTASGWCDTSDSPWNWSVGAGMNTCRKASPNGSDQKLCMSGQNLICDGSGWNNGWTLDASLGNSQWDYAYQAAPNHAYWQGVSNFMVAGFEQTSHTNNVNGADYAMRSG